MKMKLTGAWAWALRAAAYNLIAVLVTFFVGIMFWSKGGPPSVGADIVAQLSEWLLLALTFPANMLNVFVLVYLNPLIWGLVAFVMYILTHHGKLHQETEQSGGEVRE